MSGKKRRKTNAEAFKDSYVEANAAFNHWCEGELERRSCMCTRDESCDVCHARWYSLPFDTEGYERMVVDVGAAKVKSIPGNAEADEMLVEAGLLDKSAEFVNPGRRMISKWRRQR